MTARLDIHSVDPKAHQAVFAMERYIRDSGLDPRLYELVKIRASQLNGCAFCLDMHTQDARAAGESGFRQGCLRACRAARAAHVAGSPRQAPNHSPRRRRSRLPLARRQS